jgi:hypothetical protein
VLVMLLRRWVGVVDRGDIPGGHEEDSSELHDGQWMTCEFRY